MSGTAVHVLATQFASSPAGYITGVTGPALFLCAGYAWRRLSGRLDRQDIAMATNTQALAVLITQHETTTDTANKAESTATDLDRSVAVLQDRLDRHEKWSDEQARIARETFERLTGQTGLRGGRPHS